MAPAKENKELIQQLSGIRHQYGPEISTRKEELLQKLARAPVNGARTLKEHYNTLLFLIAYPDNYRVYELATLSLQNIRERIERNKKLQMRLYNSGISDSRLSASFSFEVVKWLRAKYGKNILLTTIEAEDGQIMSILSVVMPKVESEIFQDANATWKPWLMQHRNKGEDLLDILIRIFDQTDLRPEVKDELWNALGIDIEVKLTAPEALPESLYKVHYHRTLIKRVTLKDLQHHKPIKIKLTDDEAERIIESGRMVLIKHFREIDPVTFCEARLVSYYQLPHGLTIALMGTRPERRHPIDSYMGYVAFKNGLPLAYAGSWMLFDSARIGLNVFPAFRGGESQYAFAQILHLHQQVYNLNRLSVDPYQIGKDNDDGIQSGAFWLYYRLGFRPVREEQRKLAESEYAKLKVGKGYRSPEEVLRKLADSKLELILSDKPVRFDAADISLVYANILNNSYGNDRKTAERRALDAMTKILKPLKLAGNENLSFVVKNWCVLLFENVEVLKTNESLREMLKKLFQLKAEGNEEEYIRLLQKSKALRRVIEGIVSKNKEVILK